MNAKARKTDTNTTKKRSPTDHQYISHIMGLPWLQNADNKREHTLPNLTLWAKEAMGGDCGICLHSA